MEKSVQHKAALYWAAQGLNVFPCLPGAKEPAVAGGYKAGTTDPKEIDRWWYALPDYNPAACPEFSGLCILDIDDKPGKDGSGSLRQLEAAHDCLPATRVTLTPSGGRHLWFKGSLPSTASKLGKDIDTRGRGGYVLLPGAVVDGKSYTITAGPLPPVPQWITDALTGGRAKERATTDEEDAEFNIDRARTHLEQLVEREDVAVEGEGGHGRTYKLFCTMRDLGLSEGLAVSLLEEVWNPYCDPPWDEDELELIAGHAWDYSQNEAGSKGGGDPAGDYADIKVDRIKPKTPVKKSKFYAYDEDEQDAWTEPDWIIKNRIPKWSTVMYYGSPGAYKSFVVLDEVLALSHGLAGFDAKTSLDPLSIVYAAGEAAVGIAKQRRPAWRQANKISGKLPFKLIKSVPWIGQIDECTAFIKQLEDQGLKPDIIIFDTLARAMVGMNENDAMDAGRAIAAIDAIRDHFACTVILVHHSGKDDARGARGSSAFLGGFDVMYQLEATPDALAVKVTCKKMKDAEEAPPLYLKGYKYGKSLVFRSVHASEYRDLTRSQYDVTRSDVGKALDKIMAYPPRGVVTRVLASELIPYVEDELPDDRRYREDGMVRRLNKRGKTDLRAYLVSDPGESPIRWGIPKESSPTTPV